MLTADAAAPLDAIARDAGVGIGTLYRHFPSREALVEAVYRTELDRLCAGADGLLARYPPERALRLWMARYADFVATKRGMADALRAVIASGAVTSAQTRERLGTTIAAMLAAGVSSGVFRRDARAEDVCALLVGVVLTAVTSAQRGRMLDLLVAGLRQPSANRPSSA